MTEYIRVSVNHIAWITFLSTIGGFMISTLVLKYYFARRRSKKMSPSQSEMMRLAEYIQTNHPGQVQEGSVTDIAIGLIDKLHKQKTIT